MSAPAPQPPVTEPAPTVAPHAAAGVPTVESRLHAILQEVLGCDTARMIPGAFLENDLGADSLDRIEILMEIEDRFAIEITDAQAKAVETVAQLVALVERIAGEAA